jgi:hypothetical protein
LKALLATGAAMVLWPWFAAGCVIALRGLLSCQHFYFPAVLALPLRTAAVLPFMVVGLLALASRRARPGTKEGSPSFAG